MKKWGKKRQRWEGRQNIETWKKPTLGVGFSGSFFTIKHGKDVWGSFFMLYNVILDFDAQGRANHEVQTVNRNTGIFEAECAQFTVCTSRFSPSLIHGLCAFFASNSRFMRLFQAALDTPLDSPFSAILSVHGLHFTVCAPSKKIHFFGRVPFCDPGVCSNADFCWGFIAKLSQQNSHFLYQILSEY